MGSARLHCPICANVIGVYEPTVVLDEHDVRHSSLAQEPSLAQSAAVVLHREWALDPSLHPSASYPA
jgi:hypothetical protein